MPDLNRIVYLLCELKARDFDSRVLIAAELLKRRHAVVLGQRWSIAFNAPRTHLGCYLFPTPNAIQAATMVGVGNAGHILAVADEEALALTGDAVLLNIAPETMTSGATFLAHSAAQFEIVQRTFPQTSAKLCGSARVDLLRTEVLPKIADRESYVLFNTNFPMTNGLWGDRAAAAQPLIQAGLTDIPERFAFEEARRAALIPVIERACDSLSCPIVIRPHPAENPAFWHDLVAGRSNARVVVGESPGPWIAGARIVVHADCTTGLEASLMSKPVLNISTHAWGEKFLMRDVNTTVGTPDEAWAILENFIVSGTPLPPPRKATAALFPTGGAATTAETLAALLKHRNASALSGQFRWERVTRPDVLKHKFTVTRDEVANHPRLQGLHPTVHELDDSAFLLMP